MRWKRTVSLSFAAFARKSQICGFEARVALVGLQVGAMLVSA